VKYIPKGGRLYEIEYKKRAGGIPAGFAIIYRVTVALIYEIEPYKSLVALYGIFMSKNRIIKGE
jgi:hypothetical protein